MTFHSLWMPSPCDAGRTFRFFSNVDNWQSLMPEQIVDWSGDYDTCSFTIKGMTSLSLKVEERVQDSLVRLVPTSKLPFSFDLKMYFRQTGILPEVMVAIDADLNGIFEMMAKKPLQNLVYAMGEKIPALSFKE